jgi:pre-mRNA-splicing factor CWC26
MKFLLDDPMLEYLRSKANGDDTDNLITVKKKSAYRGPPAPPNRYKILPGSRWDGVDRSNGK